MNENNNQPKRITKESIKMFYMTKKGRKLKHFKSVRKITTIALSIVMVLAVIAEVILGVGIAVLGTRISGNGDDTVSELGSNFEQVPINQHEGVSYILVAGLDNKDNYGKEDAKDVNGYYHTDILAIACINHVTKEINVMQIPRDLFIGTDIPSKKINAVYANPREGENRMNALRRRLSSHLGITIDHYVIFTVEGFMNVIDAIGGVEIYIHQENGIYIEDQFTHTNYKIGPGWVKLNGNMASGFVRKRSGTAEEGYVLGDPDRLEAQRLMYVALAKKLMNMSATNLVSAVSACYGEVSTSMSIDDILGYAMDVRGMQLSNISVWGMPGQQLNYQHYDENYNLSYYSIHKQEYVDMWNEHMNPFGEPLTVEGLKIRELHTELGVPYHPSSFTQGGSLGDIEQEFEQNHQ
ncbi:MAG: LCP family protein [Clostridia bacterium]|nr:LCP family protein [Clostridia bacterium]